MGKRSTLLSLLFILLLLIAATAAASIGIEKEAITSTVVRELAIPAKFDLTIKNSNPYEDSFVIDTLLDISLEPKGPFEIPANSKETIDLTVAPSQDIKDKYSDYFSFSFYVKGQRYGTQTDTLVIKIVPFADVFAISIPGSISRDVDSLNISIINTESIQLDNISLNIDSALFSKKAKFSLAPQAKEDLQVDLESQKLQIEAGDYPVTFTFTIADTEIKKEQNISLEAVENTTTTEKTTGFIFFITKNITSTNIGNIPTTATIELEKSSFAKSFTTFSKEPDSESKVDAKHIFTWQQELAPGESFSIEVKTNYLSAIAVLIAVVIIGFLLNIYLKKGLIVKKKGIKVKTKTGEFALKLVLLVRNKGKPVSGIKVIDRLPALATLHERFGTVKPDKVEKDRLIWNIEKLAKGEERIFSYVIYSKVEIIGRLIVPATTVHYKNIKGEEKEARSNRIYLLF